MKRVYAVASLLLAVGSMLGCGLDSALGLAPDGGTPVLMTRVLVTREGGGYKIQFSLQDRKLKDTSANGALRTTFFDYSDSSTVFYDQAREIKKGDFKKYKTVLGGNEVWAYVFIVPSAQVLQYGSDTFARARLHLVLNDGTTIDDEESFFL
jgi:hypothetical protein